MSTTQTIRTSMFKFIMKSKSNWYILKTEARNSATQLTLVRKSRRLKAQITSYFTQIG